MGKKCNGMPMEQKTAGKPLRKFVYTTVLFACLTTALYSIKAYDHKRDGLRRFYNEASEPQSELILRLKRTAEESETPEVSSIKKPKTNDNNLNGLKDNNSRKGKLAKPAPSKSTGDGGAGREISKSTLRGGKKLGKSSRNSARNQLPLEISENASPSDTKSNSSGEVSSASEAANATLEKPQDEIAAPPANDTGEISSDVDTNEAPEKGEIEVNIPAVGISVSSASASSTVSSATSSTVSSATSSTSSSTEKPKPAGNATKPTKKPKPTKGTTTELPVATTTEIYDCDEPAYHEFPDDLFSNKQRAQGFIVIHILVGIYMFYALAVVCDEYFVASMEKICQKMGLSEDVAGATFMAAGSSAPELFASLLGVFVAKGDVGTGTIVGSAVFNILFVIGFCGLFAGQVVLLNWWPLLRDSFYYSLTVIALIAVLADSYVTWWESVIMLLMYIIYIVIMKYNTKIHLWLMDNTRIRVLDEIAQASQGILTHDEKQVRSSYVQFNNDMDEKNSAGYLQSQGFSNELTVDEIIRDFPRKMTLYEAALKVMSSRYFRPKTRFRSAGKRLIIEKRYLRKEGFPTTSVVINEYEDRAQLGQGSWHSSKVPCEEWKRAPSVANQGIALVIKWFITIPILATLHYTIPDCRTGRWERWYLLTFFTAMLWIAFFSYILVWMVTLVGYTLGVPDTVMGITFLAAGTSIPDAYSSLLVAKQGFGDMAVSNSIGSNVFDILVGLSLPWFLQTAIVEPNSMVRISSRGLVYNVLLLFFTIAATIAAVHYCRWRLNKRLGVTLLLTYVVFLVLSLLIEFNVFGYVNPPECEE